MTMSKVGQKEILTQRQVIQFFKNELGYTYLGHWKDRQDNRNVEEKLLGDWLRRRGYNDKVINKVLYHLGNAKAVSGSKTLYDANREVYGLLRYGVKVRPDIGEQNVTVWLIDWENPDKNDFAIAEEVTVAASDSKSHDKRPDIVLYVNGIALGVLELKRSTISVTEGIRQNLDNQKKEFIRPFFATVQLVMAGNDTEGLRYGVIETKEKYWLSWKEENANWSPSDPPDIKYLPDDQGGSVTGRLHSGLKRLVSKDRLLTLIHDFTVFDAGTKKTCRHNQFFGVLAAQQRVKRREGGIIWHTQGSGKSLTMVWLAKWIREHVTNSRVLIIYRKMLADYFGEPEESAMYKVERFEKEVKQRFIDQPGQMKLLIVVDKLLTGFDAPAATYLYIDKKMENHGLFQVLSATARLWNFVSVLALIKGSVRKCSIVGIGSCFASRSPNCSPSGNPSLASRSNRAASRE